MAHRTMPGAPVELKSLSSVAKAFSLPHETPPIRLPSFPALEKTAVLTFNQTATITVTSDPNLNRGAVFRQAAYPLWMDVPDPGGYAFGYSASLKGNYADLISVGDMMYITSSQTGFTNGSYHFHGPPTPTATAIVARDEATGPGLWFWVPYGLSIICSLEVGGPASNGQIEFEQWRAPGDFVNFGSYGMEFALAQGMLVMPVSQSGWYRLRSLTVGSEVPLDPLFWLTVVVASNMVQTVNDIAWTSTPTRAFMPLIVSSAYKFSKLPFNNTRTTASAALFTNVSKVLNKEGTVMAARLTPESYNVFDFSKADFSDIHPSEKYFYGLEKGFYTYVPPSTDLSSFWDYTVVTTTGSVYPLHRLDNNALVNCFLFSDPDGDTSLAVNVDWHIEFRSSSQLWPVGLSAMPLETLHQAQVALVAAGFFFDNIDHRWILSKVNSAVNFLRPAISSSGVGQAGLALYDQLAKQYNKKFMDKPVPSVKPTTLQLAPPVAKPVKVKGKGKAVKVKGKSKKK